MDTVGERHALGRLFVVCTVTVFPKCVLDNLSCKLSLCGWVVVRLGSKGVKYNVCNQLVVVSVVLLNKSRHGLRCEES